MSGANVAVLADEAAAWVARMDKGGWSQGDEAELQRWLASDARRAGALLQAQAAWSLLDRTAIEPAAIGSETDDPAVPRPMPPGIGRRRLVLGGGSAIAATLVGGLSWLQAATRYSTAVGEIRRVPLADGSIATINTASEVAIKLAVNQRNVTIEQGEAWFQVAKDPSRPFRVEAGQAVVQAVGTAFSVRRRDGGAEVLVNEGVVEAWASGADGDRLRLVAGQRAFVGDRAALRIEPALPSSVDHALAWRAGLIDLAGDTLAEAVAEFNRYNNRHLVLLDPGLAQERFDGVFRTDDPESFARAVSASFGTPLDYADPSRIGIGRPAA